MEVTVAQMKQIEQNADAKGLSYTQMMENAGTRAAEILLQKAAQPLKTAAVFCGSGNNGGDGFVLARVLKKAGAEVLVVLAEGLPKTPDAVLNSGKAKKLGIPCLPLEELAENHLLFIQNADAVTDAIYGTGFHGQLREKAQKAARLMNTAKGFKLALDLPSGLEADTGRAAPGAVKADCTVTFHAKKPCHRLNPAQCGRVEIASIGVENIMQ